MHFGKQIEEARKAKGWRQEDLADTLGVTQQAVQKWEATEEPPFRSRHLPDICEKLGIEMPAQQMMVMSSMSARKFAAERLERVISSKRLPPLPDLAEQLRSILPPAMVRYARQPVIVGDKPYLFTYTSPRVVLQAIWGSPNGASPMQFRIAAWRMTIARLANNDSFLANRHYLLVVMRLPNGEALTSKVNPQLRKEAHMMDFAVEEVEDTAHLAELITKLEETQTVAEKFFQENPVHYSPEDDFDDLL